MRVITTLQGRLAGSMAGVILVAGVLGATGAYVKAFRDANELQDTHLQQISHLAAALDTASPGLDPTAASSIDPDALTVIERLPAGGLEPYGFPPHAADGLTTVLKDGQPWRAAAKALPDGRWIVARQRTEVRDEVARHSAWQALLPLLAMIPVLIALVGLVIGRAMRSVREIGASLDRTEAHALHALSVDGVPGEILPFVCSVNAMIWRVREGQRRQQRFIADAAHELRTPVTALALQADNLASIELPPPARQRLGDLQAGLRRTEDLLEQLLSLSRLRDPAHQPAPPPCIVVDVLTEVVAELFPLAGARGIDIGVVQASPCRIACAAFDLRMLLKNVLSNAIRHASEQGQIDIAIHESAGRMTLTIDDDGRGIAADDQTHLFEPFYKARDNVHEGTGLGLAIVRAIADRLEADVSIGPRPGDKPGCRFEFDCPTVAAGPLRTSDPAAPAWPPSSPSSARSDRA